MTTSIRSVVERQPVRLSNGRIGIYTAVMRAYAKIICEQLGHLDQWAAWFEGHPGISAGGEWPSMAIERLIEIAGREEFVLEEISAIDSACTESHQEFMVPFSRIRRIPRTSSN